MNANGLWCVHIMAVLVQVLYSSVPPVLDCITVRLVLILMMIDLVKHIIIPHREARLFVYLLKAPSTAQGHLRAVFTGSNLIQVEYNTKHAHFIKVKYINIIRKLVSSALLS